MIKQDIASTYDLQAENEFLRNQLSEQKKHTSKLTENFSKLTEYTSNLEEQLAWFKKQIFGSRSERTLFDPVYEQPLLPEFQMPEKPASSEETHEVKAHTRKKHKSGNDKFSFPEDIPVERIVLDISETEKRCSETGLPLVKVGEEISRKLAYKPGSYFVKEYVRPKYASLKLPENGITIVEMPDSILPKCCADESLLANIITMKFADHLPLYRINEIFLRDNIHISRQLLSQWVLRIGKNLFPLYKEMLNKILCSGNIFVDESPVSLLIPGNKKVHQAYMWVYVGGDGADPPYRVYDFNLNRKYKNTIDVLSEYEGVLHSDKYGAYEELARRSKIVWSPCWSHIRRQFIEAESGDIEFRNWMLKKIRYLFMFERIAWTRSAEERIQIRTKHEVPIIDEMIKKVKKKLVDGNILPKSKFKQALGYFCGLIPHLKNYTKYAKARMDNNVAERAVRPLAIGRKNWLFAGSENGGKAAATLLSLVQTCRNLKINPREYLEDIMRRIMGHSTHKLHELLPDQWAKNR